MSIPRNMLRGKNLYITYKTCKQELSWSMAILLELLWPPNYPGPFPQIFQASWLHITNLWKAQPLWAAEVTAEDWSPSPWLPMCSLHWLRRMTKQLPAYMWSKGNLIISPCISSYLTPSSQGDQPCSPVIYYHWPKCLIFHSPNPIIAVTSYLIIFKLKNSFQSWYGWSFMC